MKFRCARCLLSHDRPHLITATDNACTVQQPLLVVEDDPNDVLLLQRAFVKAGLNVEVHVVSSGDHAIDYLRGAGRYQDRSRYPVPELMLLDLKLPRKSGLEVLEWVRGQDSPLRRLPVIVFTSSQQSVDVNRAYDFGANSYMVKPGRFDELIELVEALNRYWFSHNEKPEVRNRV